MKEFGLELFPQTQAVIEQGIQQNLHTCAQVYILQDDEALASFALGEYKEGSPCTVGTIMPWMSCSKMITAVAFAILYERGLVDFDTNVSEVIPEFSCNGKENITFKNILNHTCGIRVLPIRWNELTWEETVQAICGMPVEDDWVVGEAAGYHIATSWFILGEAVQRLSGSLLEEFIQQEIFQPLGMENSYFSIASEIYNDPKQPIARFLRTDGETPKPAIDRYAKAVNKCRPGASGRGPVRELAIFMQMLSNKGMHGMKRILSERTVELLTSPAREGLLDRTFMKTIDWGLGFMLDSKHHQDSYPYSFGEGCSEETFGHNGNQSSAAYVDPENELVICFVFNGIPGEIKHQKRLDAMNKAIYQDLDIL